VFALHPVNCQRKDFKITDARVKSHLTANIYQDMPAENTLSVSPHLTHPKYRQDIDGLRAIAVLSIVLFHAFPEWRWGGFIGVDIFYVISGFLIATIIFENLERGSFSFSEFYSRRIRRIFPALLVILLTCFCYGWFVLLANEYKQLGKYVASGAAFIANFILWSDSGYFDTAAETKPLLHLWSLGIEEQFYLVYPPLLWLAWKYRLNLLYVTLFVAVVSFALNIYAYRGDPVGDFYSPQTRFWELMSGAILAYLTLQHKSIPSSHELGFGRFIEIGSFLRNGASAMQRTSLSILGVMLVAVGFLVITKESYFPSWWAILPVLGTVLIISAGPHALINRSFLSNRVLVWFGLISYPLYLWHWPLLSFARLTEGQTPPIESRVIIFLVSVVLAWLTFQLVEKPLRFGGRRKLNTILLFALMVVSGLAGYGLYRYDGLAFRNSEKDFRNLAAQYRKWDYRVNQACLDKYGKKQLTFCITNSSNPEVILFGDSHANQLYPGLVKAYENKKGILSIGNGPPLDSVIVTFQNVTNHPWRLGFISYKKVLQTILGTDELKTVIISSYWEALIHGYYAVKEGRAMTGNIYLSLGNQRHQSDNLVVFNLGFERMIYKLLQAKKNIIVVIDTPEPLTNPEVCLKNIHSEQSCSFKKSGTMERQQYFRNYIQGIKRKYPQIRVFDPVPLICPDDICYIHDGKHLLYRDISHISEFSSEKIGRSLRELIDAGNQ